MTSWGKRVPGQPENCLKRITKEKHVEIQILDELHNAYLNGFKVNPIDYIMLDKELRKEYEDEFGIDSNDTGYDYYTHEQQIEIYSKNMLFWIKHKPNIGSDNFMEIDSDVQANLSYVTSHMSQLERKILELTPALQKSIHGRVK